MGNMIEELFELLISTGIWLYIAGFIFSRFTKKQSEKKDNELQTTVEKEPKYKPKNILLKGNEKNIINAHKERTNASLDDLLQKNSGSKAEISDFKNIKSNCEVSVNDDIFTNFNYIMEDEIVSPKIENNNLPSKILKDSTFDLRSAMIMKEILDKPLALRR